MTLEVYEQFKGLFTAGDDQSVDGSPDCKNIDIDINGDIVKAKGIERVVSSNIAVLSMIFGSSTVLTTDMVASGVVAVSSPICLYDVSNESAKVVLYGDKGKAWKVTAVSGYDLTIGADTSSIDTTEENIIKDNVLFNEQLDTVTDSDNVIKNGNINAHGVLKTNARNYITSDLITGLPTTIFDGSTYLIDKKIIHLWVKMSQDIADIEDLNVKYLLISRPVTIFAVDGIQINLKKNSGNYYLQLAINDGANPYVIVSSTFTYSKVDSLHFMICLDNTGANLTGSNTVELYFNNTLLGSSTSTWTPFYMTNQSYIGANYDTGTLPKFSVFDLSLIGLSGCISSGVTYSNVKTALYNNTYNVGGYRYVYEYGNTAKIDLSLMNLTNFVTSGGIDI